MMNGSAVAALTAALFGFSGLLLLVSGLYWLKLARETDENRRAIPVHTFRSAARITAPALIMLGLAAFWLAFTSAAWSN